METATHASNSKAQNMEYDKPMTDHGPDDERNKPFVEAEEYRLHYNYAHQLIRMTNRYIFIAPIGDPTVGNRDMGELLSRGDEFIKQHRIKNNPSQALPQSGPPSKMISSTPTPSVLPTAGSIYTTLDPSQDQFRLLSILPATYNEAPLQCQLHVCALNNICTYSALSYTWHGSLKFKRRRQGMEKFEEVPMIECNGIQMFVGLNLFLALRRLRKPTTAMVVWADAICINQTDLAERSQQVSRMGDIFRNAYEVIVWLGQDDSDQSLVFEGVCSVVSTWASARGEGFDLPTKPQFFVRGQQPVKSLRGESNTLSSDSRDWPGILSLYNRRWFHRLWVVQEIALARQATVICNDCEISWEWVGLAAAIIRTNWNRILPGRTGDDRGGYRDFFDSQEGPSRRQVPPGIMNAYFMYRVSDFQQFFEPLSFSFCELLALTRQFECQDKRDNIFGLLGLPTTDGVNSYVKPDYTISLEETYRNLAYAMVILKPNSLAFLSHVHHWDSSGYGYQNRPAEQLVPLPSWVPIWSTIGPQTLACLDNSVLFSFRSVAECRLLDAGTLAVRGRVFAGERIMAVNRLFDFRSMARELHWQRDEEREDTIGGLLQRNMYSIDDLEVVAITIMGGKGWYGTPIVDRQAALEDFAHGLLAGWLMWTLREGVFGETIVHVVRPRAQSKPVATVDDINELARKGNGNLAVDAVATTCSGRCLFTTSSGMKGVGPYDMKPGDSVCIIYGTPTPFIVRKVEGEGEVKYSFVGECYIDDLMPGKIGNDGGKDDEWFYLV
ncbi:heterokaryon incompatibility protein-domain-containing protein [Podospora fimiseda]|uniref:Heterokaryon incompatibility protein-domain-containing protein n=1 Tax=Podospora fimiseda TaxID=252190 RepID=A0AAN6YKS0_9PEZI|nr:heterokaryon incompatibility protein-domain-containing protein [Podospora fimiseda]